MSKLSSFFELINDNSWHSINGLSKALDVPPSRLSQMSKLLAKHSIIEYRQDEEQVKMNPEWRFLCEERPLHTPRKVDQKNYSPERNAKLANPLN